MHEKGRIKLGMVQINNSFSGQNYLPYSLGFLQSYAQKYVNNIDDFDFLMPIYKRISIESALKNLMNADIVFFSTYVWNVRVSLEIAKQIKQKKPSTLIVFGGPSVPYKQIDDFLQSNPFIDLACHGEGELIFSSILKNYFDRKWREVSSVSYIDNSGKVVTNPMCRRISDLSRIPSPYLEGTFEPLLAANPQEVWVALLETNRGCPFSCTYCDWGSAIKNKVHAYDIERIFREIDWFAQKKIEFIFCCDANFGILSRDLEIVNYLVTSKMRQGYPKAFSVQNTKDSTQRIYDIYKLMTDAGLNKGVSLSVQSLNRDTLSSIKRNNITSDTFRELQQRFTVDKIETFTDLILGLPDETYASFLNGVSCLIENGQHNRIQFNNLSILPNAEMADSKYQNKYGFNIVESKIINIHGSLADAEEIYEMQQLVVGSLAMPKPDWIKARALSWVVSLLHFDKLLQVIFIILHKYFSISYRELFELFTDIDKRFRILSEIEIFFINKARGIQNGDAEYCASEKWLNIWWPADELVLIKLCTENKLVLFYEEATELINELLEKKSINLPKGLLRESIILNQSLLKLPFQREDLDIKLSYNLWEVYQNALMGSSCQLKNGTYCYRIDRKSNAWLSWQDWCREVIWYGNKRGAYLYDCCSLSLQTK